jgi:hypothetical protein
MADISKIKLPDTTVFNIKDEVARQMTLEAEYTPATYDLELKFVTAASADNEEF